MASNGTRPAQGFAISPVVSAASMTSGMQIPLRIAVFGCAAALGVQAIWMTLPEISVTQKWAWNSRDAAPKQRLVAEWAAYLGVMRGDLWTEFALSYNDLAWGPDRRIRPLAARQNSEQAQAVVKRALGYSPHDARLWLLLAALEVQLEGLDRQPGDRALAALKMAYYTGPNELELAPYRLMIAVRPGVLADQELQQLVRNELRMLMIHAPQLKSAIIAAYREASPAARGLFEDVAYSEDPELLRSARSDAGGR